MSADAEADVVVVGAGLAGLTAARDLVAAGCSVIVAEARDRVGGRVVGWPVGDGKIVEMGGQFAGPTQDRILALAAELGVATFPTYDDGARVLHFNGKRGTYTGAISLYEELLEAEGLTPLLRSEARAAIGDLRAGLPAREPWDR
jgi:monoamine oxidase